MRELPSREELLQRLSYDPATGKLIWKARTGETPKIRAWNTQFAGKEAFKTICAKGYAHGTINSENYKKHRVVWKMVYGSDPNVIDHINGCRADNRIENLRDATVADNARNQRIRRDNNSGHVGVHWMKANKRWQAFINLDGKSKHLGLFDTFENACAARSHAESQSGYHPNHGRTA